MIHDWARHAQENKWLVLDIESTCGGRDGEMIDLAIVESGTGNILFNSLIKPTSQINPFAQAVHGIDHRILANAPYLEEIAEQINSTLAGKDIITYNAPFDSRLFKQSYERYNLTTPDVRWHCLMQRYTKHLGRQVSLDFACQHLKVKPGNHRALSDSLAAARLLYKLAKGDALC